MILNVCRHENSYLLISGGLEFVLNPKVNPAKPIISALEVLCTCISMYIFELAKLWLYLKLCHLPALFFPMPILHNLV